jgi:hypothetical protein
LVIVEPTGKQKANPSGQGGASSNEKHDLGNSEFPSIISDPTFSPAFHRHFVDLAVAE